MPSPLDHVLERKFFFFKLRRVRCVSLVDSEHFPFSSFAARGSEERRTTTRGLFFSHIHAFIRICGKISLKAYVGTKTRKPVTTSLKLLKCRSKSPFRLPGSTLSFKHFTLIILIIVHYMTDICVQITLKTKILIFLFSDCFKSLDVVYLTCM